MPEYADIYVLSDERKPSAIRAFLDDFISDRVESADEYEVPQYSSDPHVTFCIADDLIDYCCSHNNESHTVYWRSGSSNEHAMVFFLKDGNCIFGISTPAENSDRVDCISSRLMSYFHTKEVIVTYEDLPPLLGVDFRNFFEGLPEVPEEVSAEEARRTRAHKPIKLG